ncbi:hypothetical protein J2T47_000427 [Pseudomonas nitroreducens]|nr:hypothetical protein [Pseudomonas nitroreducens]
MRAIAGMARTYKGEFNVGGCTLSLTLSLKGEGTVLRK